MDNYFLKFAIWGYLFDIVHTDEKILSVIRYGQKGWLAFIELSCKLPGEPIELDLRLFQTKIKALLLESSDFQIQEDKLPIQSYRLAKLLKNLVLIDSIFLEQKLCFSSEIQFLIKNSNIINLTFAIYPYYVELIRLNKSYFDRLHMTIDAEQNEMLIEQQLLRYKITLKQLTILMGREYKESISDLLKKHYLSDVVVVGGRPKDITISEIVIIKKHLALYADQNNWRKIDEREIIINLSETTMISVCALIKLLADYDQWDGKENKNTVALIEHLARFVT